jgi:hypothetical protein
MARVPTAESLGLGSGPGKIVPLQGRLQTQASPADFGAQQAQVIGGFGQDLQQGGAQLWRAQQAVEERDATLSANKAGLEAQAQWLQTLEQRKNEADIGAPGFTEGLTKDFDDYRQKTLEGVKPGRYRDLMDQRLQQLGVSLLEDGLQFEGQAKRAKADTDAKASIDAGRNVVFLKPETFGTVLGQQLQVIESSSLPPGRKAELAQATTSALTEAMWRGQGERDPRGTLQLLQTHEVPGLEYADRQAQISRLQTKIDAEDREAERKSREGMAEGQQALSDRVDDAAALLRDGKDPGVLPTLADVQTAFPATQVPRVWAKVQDKIRLGRAVGSVAGKTFAEQDAILAGMQPDPAAPNYADQVAMRDATATAINQERSALRQDPAAYTQRHNPAVARAFEEAGQDPSKTARAIAMSLAEQERIGVAPDKVAPLPKESAGSLVERFKTAQTSDERLGLLAPITLGLQDDVVGRKILDQLEEAGLPPATALALERFREGDIGAAREILGYITADPKDAPKLGDAVAKDVQSEVDGLFDPGEGNAASLAARAASLVPDPTMQRSLELQRSTMLRLAQSYAATGMDADDAAARAYKIVYGGKQAIVDDELGAVTVPQGVDGSDLEAGLENTRRTADLSGLTPRREQYPNDGAWELALRDHDQRVQDLREGGQWLDGPNGGFVLIDPLLGTAVPGPDGKPRLFTLEEVTGKARAPADLSGLSLSSSPGNPWALAQPAAAPADVARLRTLVRQAETGGEADPGRARSEADAVGPMQITAGAAREVLPGMGLQEVLQRDDEGVLEYLLEHPDEATEAGNRYLDLMLERYDGNTALAVAAYHAGAGNVDKWLERYGDPREGRLSDREWAARIPGPRTRGYTLKVLASLGGNDALSGGAGDDRLGAGAYAPPGYVAKKTGSGVEYERNPGDPYWRNHEPPMDLWGKNANVADYLRNIIGLKKGWGGG